MLLQSLTKKYFLHFKVSNEKSFCTGKIKNKDYNAMVLVVKKWRKPENANGNGKTRQQIVYYVTVQRLYQGITISYSIISTCVTVISLTLYAKYGLQGPNFH